MHFKDLGREIAREHGARYAGFDYDSQRHLFEVQWGKGPNTRFRLHSVPHEHLDSLTVGEYIRLGITC